ncbi:MAG: exodeoxyribonuclease V subunit gamma, partial [Bacteroidales bacterium]
MQHIYISNQTENLCLELVRVLKTFNTSPFIPLRLIVPHAGMEAWLKFQLSTLNGVFCNFLFQGLDDILTDIWQLTGNNGYAASRLKLKFKLYLLLNDSKFKATFSDIAKYYTNDDCRRLQLAEKLADIFDQYQVYRPDLIEKWNQSSYSSSQKEEEWECYLWRQLMQDKELVLKIDVYQQILSLMENPEVQSKIKESYPYLIFFTQSHFPDFYWELIKKLDRISNIHIFALLPNNEKTYKHPLLLDWGTQAQELRNRLYADDSQPIELFVDTTIQPGSLLTNLREQLYGDIYPEGYCFTKGQQQDHSIEVNGCYTPVREVECLYNYLLNLLDNNKELQLDDILVVAPDMDLYAPFIEGVFKNAPKNIPFHLAGIPKPAERSVLSTLQDIMEFSAEDFTSEKVISLLEKKRIREFFSIEDTDYVRCQVNKANIRFGWENKVDNDTVYVGWKYNLDRIVSGYLMLTDQEYDMGNNLTGFPFQDVESSAAADLIYLIDYIETLHAQLEARKEDRTLSEWSNFLFTEIVDKMIATNYDDKEELGVLHKKIGFLERTMLRYQEKISFDVFLETIRSLLFADMQITPFRPGSVRFTSIALARAIPNKVIALLGMNQKEFPRQDN